MYFSTYPAPTLMHLSHCFTSVLKPTAQKPFDCCLSHFRTWSGNICDFRTSLREFLDLVVILFTRQTLPNVNRKHFLMDILCIQSFCPQKRTTLLFGSTYLKHGRRFDYWNQPLNMYMHFCYQDCRKAGQCCYLVIHTENPLRPLQLRYCHLWPIYWLPHKKPMSWFLKVGGGGV
jgi:hypothetical protein